MTVSWRVRGMLEWIPIRHAARAMIHHPRVRAW